MFRKVVYGVMLILLFIGMLTLAIEIKPAKSAWTGTVYIRADGSIDPPGAPIINHDNVTYMLTDDITSTADGIVVERDNIVIDGAGHTVQGSDSGSGINLTNRSNVTIRNMLIKNFDEGIRLYNSSNNNITETNITLCSWYAVFAIWSNNNHISKNVISDNGAGIWLKGESNNNTIKENILEGSTYNGIGLSGVSNNSIRKNIIVNNSYGIWVKLSSSNNVISENNVVTNHIYNIWFRESTNNKVYHNNFINGKYQVLSENSTNIWDDGYPSGGNYWSDYKEKYHNAQELNGSGLWDTPYVIDENNQDRYPFMYPYDMQTCKLTITTTIGGTTSPSPGTYTYAAGTELNVTAIPNAGYSFDYWLLDEENRKGNSITILMDTNHTLGAYFVDNIPPEISHPWQDPPPKNVQPFQNVTVWVNVTDYGSGVKNVTLWYSLDNGTTWEEPINMTALPIPSDTTITYQAIIPGYKDNTWITYKIVAFDNAGNNATKDNDGFYYKYYAIPKFPSAIILLLVMVLTALAIITAKKRLLKKQKLPLRYPSTNKIFPPNFLFYLFTNQNRLLTVLLTFLNLHALSIENWHT